MDVIREKGLSASPEAPLDVRPRQSTSTAPSLNRFMIRTIRLLPLHVHTTTAWHRKYRYHFTFGFTSLNHLSLVLYCCAFVLRISTNAFVYADRKPWLQALIPIATKMGDAIMHIVRVCPYLILAVFLPSH